MASYSAVSHSSQQFSDDEYLFACSDRSPVAKPLEVSGGPSATDRQFQCVSAAEDTHAYGRGRANPLLARRVFPAFASPGMPPAQQRAQQPTTHRSKTPQRMLALHEQGCATYARECAGAMFSDGSPIPASLANATASARLLT